MESGHELSILFAFIMKIKRGVNKEIRNASKCIVELYKHAGIFKNTREVHREARGAAESFSRVFLKIPKCLYYSTMHEDEVFYLFYKMLRK